WINGRAPGCRYGPSTANGTAAPGGGPWPTAGRRSASGAAGGTTGGAAGGGRALSQQQPQPGLVQDRHAQAERLVVLGAGIVAGHHEGGFLRDRGRRLAAQRRYRLGR